MIKKRVLHYALDPNDTTSFFRISGVLPYIHSDDFELVNAHQALPKENGQIRFNWSSLVGYSALLMQRPFAPDHVALLMTAKNMGLKIILDYDDDLWNVPFTNPTYQMYRDAVLNGSLDKCVSLADVIWCSTPSIQSVVGFNTFHVPNSYNDYLFKANKKREFNTYPRKVLYRGGSSHKADVMSVADEMVKLMNQNTDWTFMWMGDRFEYMEIRTGDNHHIIPGMPIMEYFRYLNQENPSLMLFPLQTNKFNEGKSNICWLEATYAGAALFGNKLLPEFNLPFIGDINDLINNSKEILNDSELLKNMNEESWSFIKENLLLSKINEIRTESILSLL